jgi:hypothetical protein
MVEGEHPATVLVVLSRPGLEDFFAEFSSDSLQPQSAECPLVVLGLAWAEVARDPHQNRSL